MPALCLSAHDPACKTPASRAGASPSRSASPPSFPRMHPLAATVALLRDVVQGAERRLSGASTNSSSGAAGAGMSGAQRRRVRFAERYMAARIAGRHDDVLRLVSDDVVLRSSRDGRIEGKTGLRDYLLRVKPVGVWRKPTWNDAIGVAQVVGNVRILMVNVGVVAHFGFDRQNKITRIDISTKRSAKSVQ